MSSDFQISVQEWLASDATNSLERETNADISIMIGANCPTEVEVIDVGIVRKAIRVSAGLLGMWLLDNWWRIIFEPGSPISPKEELDWGMSHDWPAIGGGYVWPDLTFRGSDGSQIAVECKKSFIRNGDYSPIRYLNSFSTAIPVKSFESSVAGFVELLLQRLDSRGVRKTELHDMWKDIKSERASQKGSRYRKLEALLGLDPDVEDKLIGLLLEKWPNVIGAHALEEISAATGSESIEGVLASARKASQSVKVFGTLTNVGHLDKGVGTPWRRAQDAAYSLRKYWELGFGKISDKMLADKLEMMPDKLSETRQEAPFAMAVRGKADGGIGFVLNRRRHESRRFDIARLIGDYIYFEPEDQLRPATTAFTVRQKFQRAFAAEFLCPSEKIRERFPLSSQRALSGDVVADLAEEFEVSQQVVVHHLENRDIVLREQAQETLMYA